MRPASTSHHAGAHTPSRICMHVGAEVEGALGVNQFRIELEAREFTSSTLWFCANICRLSSTKQKLCFYVVRNQKAKTPVYCCWLDTPSGWFVGEQRWYSHRVDFFGLHSPGFTSLSDTYHAVRCNLWAAAVSKSDLVTRHAFMYSSFSSDRLITPL